MAERATKPGRIPGADLARHEATLLHAARDLFYEHGFDGTSIESIARRAHVSPKTIYARYGGKPGIFVAVMTERADHVHEALATPVEGPDDVRAALLTFATRLLAVMGAKEVQLVQRSVLAQAEAFPELARACFAAGPERGVATIAAFFARAAAAGVLDIDDAPFAADLFAGALLGMPMRHLLFAQPRTSRAADLKRATRVVDAFLRLYAPPRRR